MKQFSVTKISILLSLLLSFSVSISADATREESYESPHNSSTNDSHDVEKREYEKRSTTTPPDEVIESYFTALQSGDTVMIKNLLGGDLLLKRDRLLSNPTYQYTLQNWYRGATFSITGTYIVDANKVNVEAVVSNSNQQVKYSFLLEKDANGVFRITNETELL